MSDDRLGRVITLLEQQSVDLAHLRDEQVWLRDEQTRLRTDVLKQGERVLNEVASLRDDMTVTMARMDRLDNTVGLAVVELRAMHSAFSKLSQRERVLEGPLQ